MATPAFNINDPVFDPVPNRSLYGEQPKPGETWAQFLERTKLYMKLASPEEMQRAKDTFDAQALAQTEESKSRSILGEQAGLAKTRLNDLASLLAKTQDSQFNRDIPGIAETAQGKGMLETSGFGNALANRYKELTAQTSEELAKQGLADRDLEIKGLSDIGVNSNNLGTATLERQFSNEDLTRSEQLAKYLAPFGVPAPAKEPSTTDKALQYAGPILSGVGAVKGA